MTRPTESCQIQTAAAQMLNCFHRAHVAILAVLALVSVAVGAGSEFRVVADWYQYFWSRIPSWIDQNVMFGIGTLDILAIVALAFRPRSGA